MPGENASAKASNTEQPHESAGEKMTFRRRPIPRRAYPWLAQDRGPSLRYRLSEDGSYRIYPDGREVCVDSYAGRREYLRRLELMLKATGVALLPVWETDPIARRRDL